MHVREVIWTKQFKKEFEQIKDKTTKERLRKQIEKIIANPNVGKPLRYHLKGERAVYVAPFRLIYHAEYEVLYLLKFEHRNKVYR